MAAVGRHHRRGAAALRPQELFYGFLDGGGTSFMVSFVVVMSRVDVVDHVLDFVDVDLDVDLVDVDLVDVDLDVVPFC